MHPILFNIPFFSGFKLHTYGLLVALAFLAGMSWVSHESKRVGEPPQKLMDLCFYIVISAIIGSRIFYVLFEDSDFWGNPLSFFKIWEGGLVFHGGLLFAIAFSVGYVHRHHLNFWRVADIFSPGIAIGHAIGRIGCYMAGCCYGKPAQEGFFWTSTFPPIEGSLAPSGIPLYPIQLMEALAEGLIFLTLILIRKKKQFDGQILLLYLILYSLVRFGLDFLRDELSKDTFLSSLIKAPLSDAQIISLGLILTALFLWILRSRTIRLHEEKI